MKLYDFSLLFTYIGTFSIVIPIIFGTYFFKTLSLSLKIFYIGPCLVFFIFTLMLFFDNTIGNTFLYLLTFVDLVLMSIVFYFDINNKKARKVIMIVSVLFLPLIILDAFYISGLQNRGFTNALEKIYIMAVAIYFLTKLFQDNIEIDIAKQPLLWICTGVIIYNLVGTFDLFSNAIAIYSRNIYLQYYFFWGLISTVMYFSFAYAFYLSKFSNSVKF